MQSRTWVNDADWIVNGTAYSAEPAVPVSKELSKLTHRAERVGERRHHASHPRGDGVDHHGALGPAAVEAKSAAVNAVPSTGAPPGFPHGL